MASFTPVTEERTPYEVTRDWLLFRGLILDDPKYSVEEVARRVTRLSRWEGLKSGIDGSNGDYVEVHRIMDAADLGPANLLVFRAELDMTHFNEDFTAEYYLEKHMRAEYRKIAKYLKETIQYEWKNILDAHAVGQYSPEDGTFFIAFFDADEYITTIECTAAKYNTFANMWAGRRISTFFCDL